MKKFEIVYDFTNELGTVRNAVEKFFGTWDELDAHLVEMRWDGCFNLEVSELA